MSLGLLIEPVIGALYNEPTNRRAAARFLRAALSD
jgi:hypothetical protein